jgi:hypothetical protein
MAVDKSGGLGLLKKPLRMATMPSAEKQWAYLCKKFHAKHRALSDRLPGLFQKGVLSPDHIADYRRLNTEVEEVRKRMDELINSNSG